jgi:hypothetical protein
LSSLSHEESAREYLVKERNARNPTRETKTKNHLGVYRSKRRRRKRPGSDESDIEKMSVDSLRTLVKGYRQSPNAVEINNNDILVADFNLQVIEDY